MRISISEITALFQQIATVHPGIGHNPAGGVIRFYGLNYDESSAKERASDDEDAPENSGLGFPRLGLALKTHANLEGSYDSNGTSLRDKMRLEVVLLDNCESADFTAEEAIYDEMKGVMDDIAEWLFEVVNRGSDFDPCDFPPIEMMDFQNISYSRIGPVTNDNAFGWIMRIPLRGELEYDHATNPLKDMQPL